MIQFSIMIDESSKSKRRRVVTDESDSDDTWYPPQHPITKRRKRKLQLKPKEERWSYWMKQLPKEIEYSSEEKGYFMKQTVDARKRFIETESDLLKEDGNVIPPRFRLLQLNDTDMNASVRLMLLKKIDALYAMEPGVSEHAKMAHWV